MSDKKQNDFKNYDFRKNFCFRAIDLKQTLIFIRKVQTTSFNYKRINENNAIDFTLIDDENIFSAKNKNQIITIYQIASDINNYFHRELDFNEIPSFSMGFKKENGKNILRIRFYTRNSSNGYGGGIMESFGHRINRLRITNPNMPNSEGFKKLISTIF